MYWIRSCPATGRQECGGTFVPMPHSLSRTSMSPHFPYQPYKSRKHGVEEQRLLETHRR